MRREAKVKIAELLPLNLSINFNLQSFNAKFMKCAKGLIHIFIAKLTYLRSSYKYLDILKNWDTSKT